MGIQAPGSVPTRGIPNRWLLARGMLVVAAVLIVGSGLSHAADDGIGASGVGSTTAKTVVAKGITRVSVVSETTPTGNTATDWTDLPGASATIRVPDLSLIIARFSAVADCGGAEGTFCFVRILIGGVEGDPALGSSSIFMHPRPSGSYETHSIERSRGSLGAGTYRVKVQYKTPATNVLNLVGWSLTVEAARM